MELRTGQWGWSAEDKATVLVVDDNPKTLLAVSRLLRKHGYEVAEAADGAQCLESARKLAPSLILLDVVLPDISGTQLCKRLKQDPALADTFVVLISGHLVSSRDQALGLACGADGYIARPIGNQELLARIELMMRLRKTQNELRRKSEALLRERAQLLALFDGVDDILYVADPDTYEVLYANPALRKALGKNIIGKKCYRALQNLEAPCPFCTNHLIFGEKTGKTHVWEFQNKVNGKWYRCSDKAIPWPDGRMVRFETASDITEQKTARERLSRSESMLRHAQKIAHIGSWDLDLNENRLSWSDEVYRIFGLVPGEFEATYEAFLESVYPEDRARVDAAYSGSVKEGKPGYEITHRVIRKSTGEIRYVEEKCVHHRDESGKIQRSIGTVHDITDRKEAEQLRRATRELEKSREALYKSEERLLQAARISHLGYWELNLKTRLFTFNDLMWELLGTSAEQEGGGTIEVGSFLARFCYERDKKRILEHFRTGLSARKPYEDQVEYRIVRADGKVRNGYARYRVTFDEKGNPESAYGFHHDMTERKQMEEQIRQARDRAEAAARAKSEFLANMSHEIRTPMNAIIGLSHLALRTDLDAKQRDYMKKIDASAKSLLGIINDILDFSKIEAGKLDMERVEFNLDETLDNLAGMIGIRAQGKADLEVLFHVDSDVPRSLVGDPLRLNQVLVNLCNNAVKFTQKGEVLLTTRMVGANKGLARLEFSVRDTGIGLTEKQMENLFQPFSQADTSITRNHGGTGLGLSISKRLVEMMGGTIRVNSQPGVGSEFSFTAEFGLAEQKEKIPWKASQSLDHLKVLVIDDNPTARRIFLEMLRSFNYSADQAISGPRGLEMIRAEAENRPYDLVLMDWKMEGMDGIETALRIRQMSDLARQPKIILVTAHAMDEAIREMESSGLDGLVIKPVLASTLFETIVRAFGEVEAIRLTQEARQDQQFEKLKNIRGARILLVEDNEINQQIVRELLESAGLKVVVQNNAREAIKRLNGSRFDAVLMDIQMPGMSGYEAARKIRANPKFEKLPILAMTAAAMVRDREKTFEAGMNDHICKPIDIAELFDSLARWIPPVKNAQSFMARCDINTGTAHGDDPYPRIPGLDVKAGITRLNCNFDSYSKLLKKFASSYHRTAREIRGAIREGDRELAVGKTHALKGVAGNISADRLYRCAERLERAIKENSPDLDKFTLELSLALDKVISGISSMESANG